MTADNADRPRDYPDRRPYSAQPQWVQDFPTDIPDDEQVARREFVKFMVLTSGAFAAGQCWIGLAGRRAPESLPRRQIATLPELKSSRVIGFRYPTDDDPCLLIMLDDDRIVAFGQECSHLACAVIPDLQRNELVCPCHNGHFEIAGGRPIAGPPRRPLPRVLIEVENEAIFATGVELRTV
jgi:Rieske Fe-S protein